MRKLFIAASMGALMCMTACTQKNGYTITGTGERLHDGDSIFLNEIVENDFKRIDSTVVKDGKFEFTGNADSIEGMRFITDGKEGGVLAQIFIENGKIEVKLEKEDFRVSGTKANDALQAFSDMQKVETEKMMALYKKMDADTTLTEEETAKITDELKAIDSVMNVKVLEAVEANIDNAFGIQLLESVSFAYDAEKLLPILEKVPEKYSKKESIVRIKEDLNKKMQLAVGKNMPDITMNTPEGTPLSLGEVVAKNKYTLVDFWASWCGPCRQEMPHVVKAYAAYRAKGFEVLGVSLDENAEDWKKAIKDLGMAWPQMSDLKGWKSAASEVYAIRSIPSTFLVDQNGVIVARDLRGDALEKKLAELLK
ncbi:redoxin domain-containing protein [Bacteroides heparinolyticus]|uniref:redoxin domain-containing protein n=1 Tax=Prevotella heparinolytica TaxID=28113 RepID=UPI00359F8B0E